MHELQRIQHWYLMQCDDEWEHKYGIDLKSLDNPGWQLEIDLTGTDLERARFRRIVEGDSERDTDWIHCKVKQGKFKGACGASNLTELLGIFLDWAGG